MDISKHISLYEATRSQTASRLGIKNIPNAKEIERMKLTAEKVFEPVRVHFGKPITVSSFFRSEALNKAIGGSATSQHRFGEAIDIDNDSSPSNREIFFWIKDNLEFDQLIWEFGGSKNPSWVHVSYTNQRPNRMQLLEAFSENGKTKYTLWDKNKFV